MNHKAFVLAINEYPNCPLRGCVHDGNQDAYELSTNYGYSDPTNIRLLFDARATTDAILERLEWLVAGAEPGDHLAFCYSGHGALVPARDGKGQVDKLHSVICPVDFQWTPETMITHDQFVTIFAKLPRGAKLLWLADCCHSGFLDRELSHNPHIAIPRAFPVPHDVAWSIKAAQSRGHEHDKAVKDFVNGKLDVAFIPGCKIGETSSDTEIDGQPCGALTHYFWDATHALPPTASVKAITDLARENLGKDAYEQHPVADGTWINEPIPR